MEDVSLFLTILLFGAVQIGSAQIVLLGLNKSAHLGGPLSEGKVKDS